MKNIPNQIQLIGEVKIPEKVIINDGGSSGENGATFIPSVSDEGIISWTNDKNLPNPSPVNIKGPAGENGTAGQDGQDGADGFSPTITVKTSSSSEYILTITNSDGSYDTPNLKGSGGGSGGTGEDGATFTPSVSPEGVISWTNDKGYSNPDPVNIKGPKGENGEDGFSPTVEATTSSETEYILTITTKTGSVVTPNLMGKKGDKGDTGDQGIQGPAGADGKTPEKGVDYWTESDKQEIVADVLAALPTAEGVSF